MPPSRLTKPALYFTWCERVWGGDGDGGTGGVGMEDVEGVRR